MPAWGVDLGMLAVAALVLWARPPVALATLLGVAVLVPTPLVVPHMHFALFTVQRLLALVAVVRVLRMAAERRPSTSLRRPDPARLALLAVITVSFAVGIVATATSGYSVDATLSLATLGAQLAFLLACTVLVRELETPWHALAIAGGVLGVDLGIALIEHAVDGAWGHWVMGHLEGQGNLDASHPLAVRDGQTRVRGGSEFALQFAWITLMLLPAALVTLARRRAGLLLGAGAAGAAGLAIYWAYSRSALAALVAVVVLVALLARGGRDAGRDPTSGRASGLALAGMAAGLFAYALVPSLPSHLQAGGSDASVVTRFHKLVPIFARVAEHPFRGLGLGNLSGSGYHTTDNALLLTYVEVGVVGLVALVLLMVAVVAHGLRAYVVARPEERAAAGACLVGVLAYLASAQIYDAFSLLQGPQVLWFLVAVATVVAERAGRPVRVRRPRLPHVAGTALAGLAVGLGAWALAPTHVGLHAVVTAEPAFRDALPYDTYNGGKYLLTTACTVGDETAATMPDVSFDCRSVPPTGGTGTIYLQAPTRARLAEARGHIVTAMRDAGGVTALQVHDTGPARTGRPSLLVTAPAWVPLSALGLLLLVPWPLVPLPPRRRREAGLRLEARLAH